MFDTATDRAFLAAILEAPDDDAPRLVYADWLDDRGDTDRAEFIRLDVRLSRMAVGDPDRAAVGRRVAELRQPNFQAWVERLPQFPGVHWELFERGFISAVRFDTPAAYFEHAHHVFAAAPIREVRLHNFYWQDASRLADSRALQRVRVLDLNDGNLIANQGAEVLMRSEHIANLHRLRLGRNSLGSAGARAIAEAPYLRGLRLLRLERNDMYDEGLRFMAESTRLGHLQVLDVSKTRAGDPGVAALAGSKGFGRLRYLDLSGNLISDDGVRALADSEVMAGLRALLLHSNRITDAGVAALAESPRAARLELVYLHDNSIRDAGAEALTRSPYLENLRELYLGGNRISDKAADELRARFGSRVNVY